MEMPRTLYDDMIAHLRTAKPEEACGLIAGRDDRAIALYPVENRLQSATAYEMDPLQQVEAMLALEAEGWDLLGIYHSHPHSPAQPSVTDRQQSYYPDAQYVIVSLENAEQPVTRSFYLRADSVHEVPFTVIEPKRMSN